MGIGRPTKPLNVTSEEREKLAMLARRPKTGQAMAMRARIVLGCDEGLLPGALENQLAELGPRHREAGEVILRQLVRRDPEPSQVWQ